MAAAYTILGENRFKIIAYDNAATAVEHATSELADLWKENKLDTIPGLGTSIINHLNELFKTGKSRHFDTILGKVNPAVFPLLEIPGIGPKKAEKLVENLGIKRAGEAINRLEKAAKSKKVGGLESFGEKSEKDILTGIERFKKGAIKEKRMSLPQADGLANEIINYLKEKLEAKIVRIDKLGSLRRQVATIGDIDLAVATRDFESVIKVFVDFPQKSGVVEKGPTGASILLGSGRQADLRVGDPDSYGAMLQYFTGSKYHNIRLRDFALTKHLSVNEYGIKNIKTNKVEKFPNEKELYNRLGMEYIPPELREDSGEIEAALKHQLPNLVELKDIEGDLQVHSDFDQSTSHDSGVNSIKEIQANAKKMNYHWIGITDHNPSVSRHTSGQIIAKITSQKSYIEQLNASNNSVRVINMLEVDILPNGNLAVPKEGLDQLDCCLVSIHSNFGMSKKDMTKRIIKGLENPVAKILAHPTGRVLGSRDGYEADWNEIMQFCLKYDKALEINGYPDRLDLPDTLVREAVKIGMKLSIGTDAHEMSQMENLKYGVSVARRGWAEKKDIINSWDYNRLIKWMKAR